MKTEINKRDECIMYGKIIISEYNIYIKPVSQGKEFSISLSDISYTKNGSVRDFRVDNNSKVIYKLYNNICIWIELIHDRRKVEIIDQHLVGTIHKDIKGHIYVLDYYNKYAFKTRYAKITKYKDTVVNSGDTVLYCLNYGYILNISVCYLMSLKERIEYLTKKSEEDIIQIDRLLSPLMIEEDKEAFHFKYYLEQFTGYLN